MLVVGGGFASSEPVESFSSHEFVFTIRAQDHWRTSGFFVKKGTKVSLKKFSGSWAPYSDSGAPGLGVEGDTNSILVNQCPWGSLIAQIKLKYHGYYNDVICFGKNKDFVSPTDGILYLSINDELDYLFDNRGELVLTLNLEGAVPSPVIEYTKLSSLDIEKLFLDDLEIRSDNFIVTLPKEYIVENIKLIPGFFQMMEKIYEGQKKLVGVDRPYDGAPLRFIIDDSIAKMNGFMAAGSPLAMVSDVVGLEYRPGKKFNILGLGLQENQEILLGSVTHELGHSFSFINGGAFNIPGQGNVTEAFAWLFSFYSLESLNSNELKRSSDLANCSHRTSTQIKSGSSESFFKDPFLPFCFLFDLRLNHGWPFFKNFFTLHNSRDRAEMLKVRHSGLSEEKHFNWVIKMMVEANPKNTQSIFNLAKKYKINVETQGSNLVGREAKRL